LRYYLIFHNKNKINMNIMELHKGGFGTKKVTSFNNILRVEKYIPRRVPHYISKDAIYELESNHIFLKDNIYKKYRPRRINYLKLAKNFVLKIFVRKRNERE
ncbi:hypothetical protein, partial [Clostridium sp.]|uniref:hypothetical protein n=1 Tax=Clostridium sp. TaxID=1506 RepID=UPI0025C5158D